MPGSGRSGAGLSSLIDRLAVRLGLLMSIALLPIGAITISVTADAIGASERATERALFSQTEYALAGQTALIRRAIEAAVALEPLMRDRVNEADTCATTLTGFVADSRVFDHAALLTPEGAFICGTPGSEATDLTADAAFSDRADRPQTFVTTGPSGTVQQSRNLAVQPIIAHGVVQGYLAIAVDSRLFAPLSEEKIEQAPEVAALFNWRGDILRPLPASDAARYLPTPESFPALERGSDLYHIRSAAGEPSVFAVVEIVPGSLFAMGAWPESTQAGRDATASYLPLIFPALMWLASLGVILFSLDFLLLRHLRVMNRQMRRFALGHSEPWRDLSPQAPAELRDVNNTFRNMARIIARDEAELETALSEKTALLREIHHRVKNNLQLIASIISLQLRQLPDPASRQVLQNVQDRVLGLAAIHRHLYNEKHLAEVRADHVLEEILRQLVVPNVSGQQPVLDMKLDPILFSADRMVPLSFVLTETIIAALGTTGAARGSATPWIDVSLTKGEDTAITLDIRNGCTNQSNGAGSDEERIATRVRDDLIRAFSAQLGATLETGPVEDSRGPAWHLSLVLPQIEPTTA